MLLADRTSWTFASENYIFDDRCKFNVDMVFLHKGSYVGDATWSQEIRNLTIIVNSNRHRRRETIHWNTHRVDLALSPESKFSFWLGHIIEKCVHGDMVAKEHHCINATLA